MPNWSIGTVEVVGSVKESVKQFLNMFLQHDIKVDNFGNNGSLASDGRYFNRTWLNDDINEYTIIEEYQGDQQYVYISEPLNMQSAWSINRLTDKVDTDDLCISLQDACKELNVGVKILAEVDGILELLTCDNKGNYYYDSLESPYITNMFIE